MGNLSKFHFLEAAIWASIAIIFFVFSFEFNQGIEIYKFGATGWPRAVILMLVLVVIGNIFHQRTHGSSAQEGRVGVTDDELDGVDKSMSSILNIVAFVFLPLDLCLVTQARRLLRRDPYFCRACDYFAWRAAHQMDHRHFRIDLCHSYWSFYGRAERPPAPRHGLTIL